ncbi:Macrolide export ATP-binding/permease protein macB 2 [Fibrisoma limi BUZ 3]|uniref:Macrolide export ATP-binding/permease protein macB 2 n=1 Tax=Fibrisoma limi BUZ 3 TaxID=1185876 RepID=I2GEU1_9BACT|nr:ABC transporter permease [Fibrisoma limi]CCH52416.1 Macrolide export ATP-binding/permease protein macB 2 [Fibrisoma limi BUZ 3]
MALHSTNPTPPDRRPPRWADRLLKRVLPADLLEELLGDLHEQFAEQAAELGEAKARRLYALEVLRFCRPYFLKRRIRHQQRTQSDYSQPYFLSPIMIRNYIKVASRNLAKNKVYSFINVFGLALGMACSLLIGLWVKDAFSYNRFLPDAEKIAFVRVNFVDPNTGEVPVTNWVTPGPLQEAIAQDVPEVAAVTKINYGPEYLIKVGDKAAKEKGHYATDDFFGVFDLPAVYGNPKAALKQTNQIVITRKVAETFFPNGLALGKTLQLNNDKFYVVGAVIENLPSNSSLQFDWLVNWKVQEENWMKTWGNNSFQTFVRLKPHVTLAQAEAAMKDIYPRRAGKNFDTGRPTLQAITDLHLYGEYENGKPAGGRIEYVRVFAIVALFILLIACINFMNLATARSATRAREVGVRKVVGALRTSLIGQFLSESLLTSLLAAALALVLVLSVLPTFNTLFNKQLTLDFNQSDFWLLLGGLVLITGFFSGSYPALFLSSLQPIKILKGRLQFGAGPALFRRMLVVFQFSMSIFLIVGMLAVGRQMNYLRTKHLGLDRENVLYWPIEGINEPTKFNALRQEILRQPSIASVTTAGSLPVNVQGSSGDLSWPGMDPNQSSSVWAMFVGSDFTRTMNIKLADGRDFRADSPADSSNYIINEATARMMAQSAPAMKDPVGKEVTFWMGKGRIVGVMKDFHLHSLHEPIKPLILCFNGLNVEYLLVKTRPGQTQQALADLTNISKKFTPDYPFNYHFLDEEYEKLYRSEQQVNTLVNYFGILAILISCLGLFGLAAFTAEQRTKEIGVRKVLGASVTNIVGLLSKDFLLLVLIALVLAVPLAWWALSQWLGTFAYHEELSWWLFGLAGLLAVLVAFLTVSYQSIKAALMNPVKSLRAE